MPLDRRLGISHKQLTFDWYVGEYDYIFAFLFFCPRHYFVFILLSEGLLQNRITFKIATLFISPQLCKASILVPACSSGSRFPQKRPLGLDRDDIWPSRRSAGHLGQSPVTLASLLAMNLSLSIVKEQEGRAVGWLVEEVGCEESF